MDLNNEIIKKIDGKTKPPGSLGKLETIAAEIARIQGTVSPVLENPHILVFAADHGLAKDGVSPYPQEVTYQMVMNFLGGGAAINVFCRTNGIKLKVVDAGVNYDFPDGTELVDRKIADGTKSSLTDRAMTQEQCSRALESGAALVKGLSGEGCNIIGFGEMGIGNTSSAALLMSQYLDIDIEECTGRGTGWNDEGLKKKKEILRQVVDLHGKLSKPEEILSVYGGFEIAMMAGAMIEASKTGIIIMVDGFISTAANIAAVRINSKVRENSIYCHCSNEFGHKKMLEYLNAEPVLELGLRLGEGTGAALAYPILKNAAAFLNQMASFDSAGVSESSEKSEQC